MDYYAILGIDRKADEKAIKAKQNYEDIYVTSRAGSSWELPKKISQNINQKYNDAAASLSPDGKTLASVYSARPNDFAGVSTPSTWEEVEAGVSPQDFTIRNFAERLAAAGDLWAALSTAPGADLRAVARYMEPAASGATPRRRARR